MRIGSVVDHAQACDRRACIGGTMAEPQYMWLLGQSVKRGTQMKKGRGWRIVSPSETGFKATLVNTFDTTGGDRIAIFRVLKNPKK